MQSRFGVLALVAAVGCGGGSDFEGHWTGVLVQAAQCADGSRASREIVMDLNATQDGDTVNFSGNTSCGIITAKADGDVANVNPVTCAPLAGANGITYTDALVGGTMTLHGNALDVNALMSTTLRAANGATLLCSGPLTGKLSRKD